MNNRYNGNRYDNNRNNYNNNDNKTITGKVTEKIKKGGKLSSTLTIEDITLPEKDAYNVASDIKGKLNTNQLRKIFEQIKETENDLPDMKVVKNKLYKLLPLVAYAVGRDNCPKDFFKLLEACITDKALVDQEDVERLIEFLTSIVAYSKYLDKIKKDKIKKI